VQKKLTITVDEHVYAGLHRVVGRRKISRFIERLVRPHVDQSHLESAYKEMAARESQEAEALEWAEATIEHVSDDPR
jgi:predicted CopG family antitoxin